MKNQQLTTTEAETQRTDGRNSWIIVSSSPVIPCHTLITDPFYEATMNDWTNDQTEDFIRNFASQWSKGKAKTILLFCPPQYLWKAKKWLDESLEDYSFQQLLISHYPNSKKPKPPLQFRPSWEGILFYSHKSNQRKITLTQETLKLNDCFVTSTPEQEYNGVDRKEHPRQRPLILMKKLIQAVTSPNELICDPFCGIGTTGIAAVQSGRRFYGIEKNNHFRYLAKKRLITYNKEEITNTVIPATNLSHGVEQFTSLLSQISTIQKRQPSPFYRIGKVIMKPTELVLYN